MTTVNNNDPHVAKTGNEKKRLTNEEFARVTRNLNVGKQTLDIAYGVLVKGKPQKYFVETLYISRGAVSQAVNRVWDAYKQEVPDGFVRIEVVLPERQAFIVKKWADEAKRKQEE
ncbi:transcriptional regulator [Salmonella enterica]|nr:transcriptional regulator [Salmonella enterica]EGK5498987.1 transcriptional regulator [Salmonella enterica]EJB9657977.1 transcriptional regulator [Salmonella enterica]EKI6155034.1 transcriptional regulator [Salmonella enterica]EMB7541261.1 transcriptional regulator [Salmonella enterica]